MIIRSLDHLVLTVKSISETCDFYERVLGMQTETFGDGHKALRFGDQKINLHQVGHEFEPKALRPTSGSADLCFLTETPLDQIQRHLAQCEVILVDGPVARTGATGPILSLYVRDPDGNLIELSNPISSR